MSANDTISPSNGPPVMATISSNSNGNGNGNGNGIANEKGLSSTAEHAGARAKSRQQPRKILTQADSPHVLGYAFSTAKKWQILCIIFVVQCSMNLNTSLYANAQKGISSEFSVSDLGAVTGAGIFLVFYAFGCELWAPWSEEYGRFAVLAISLFLVNVFGIMASVAPNFNTLIAARALGGIFSAGGSVTLGIVADMYDAHNQQYATAFVVLSSVGGSIIGPIAGGFLEERYHWRWCMWTQVIIGFAVQLLHLTCCFETRSTWLLTREARRLRATGERADVYGPTEERSWKDNFRKEVLIIWARPFKMFLTEPIVAVLSLLSGFSDALIFMSFQMIGRVYSLWNFSPSQIGLTFLGIGTGYLVAYVLFIPAIRRNMKLRLARPDDEYAQFEARLWLLLYTAPCLPIGIFVVAWSSFRAGHWAVPVIGGAIIGIANYSVYMATVDYMIAAYGPYSASATGGNGFARDFLAGVLSWAAGPYMDAFIPGVPFGLNIALTVLGGISLVLVMATFWVYFKGASLRKRSSFAQSLAHDGAKE